MPEPGIGGRDFKNPTANRRKPRRRPPARIKLPGEYAGFRLEDGRFLGEVMGESFFLPESGSGNGEPLPADTPGHAPGGIGAPSGPAMPDDDNEAEYTNLPFGPEEGDMAAGSSVSGQRPGGGGIENPGRRPEAAEKPEFTSADIPDPRDRREFESLEIAMQGAERKIALHEDRLDLFERRFKNKRIDAGAMGRARRYFEFRIGQQEALIERNEKRLTEIRADALLDAAALSPGDTPRAEEARENGAPVFPTARARPANIGSGMPGGAEALFNSDGGFWMFGLPLTAAGAVDEDALRPGAVYRIPDSAGGGTGQWKNGAFYNFDRKGDWRLRTAGDLDAYSGASDAPTPEERDENLRNRIKAGGDFMPSVFLKEPDIEKFNSNNSEGVRAVQGDDEVSFSLGDGPAFLTLPDDAAAVLVRNWDDFKPRLGLLSRLFAEDLPPKEMRRLIEAEVYKGIPESERTKPPAMAADGTMDVSIDEPYGMERFTAEVRMRAFDELVEGISGGASDEEIAELIGEFQKTMLPELMGAGRFLSEFIKDMVPGLNNVRSGIHFWNDLTEIKEEWKEGDVTGLAGNGILLLLDGLGMIPIVGSAFAPVRSGLKKGARVIGKALPRVDALVAQAQMLKHKFQWPNLKHKTDPLRIFGPTVKNLPPDVVKALGRKANWIVGDASQGYLRGLLRRMDPAARPELTIANHHIVPGATKGRRYDMAARDASAILLEDIAGWLGHRFSNFRAKLNHYEFKGGGGTKKRSQEVIDKYANAHPGQLLEEGGAPVTNVRDIRIFPQQIPIEYAIADAEMRLGQLVNRGVIDEATSVALLNGMIAESKRGTKLIGLFDYAGVFVNLLAAGSHRAHAATSSGTAEEGED